MQKYYKIITFSFLKNLKNLFIFKKDEFGKIFVTYFKHKIREYKN